MKEKKERIIPKKNYFIVVLLFVVLIGFTLYCSTWYKEITEYYNNNSVITEVASEINLESLSSFLQDNPETIIYVSASNDLNVKPFEKKFKKYIVENNMNDSIVYLDLAKEENNKAIDTIMNNYLPSKLKNMSDIHIPNIIYFKDGMIEDILYRKKTSIDKTDVVNFFSRNELIEND